MIGFVIGAILSGAYASSGAPYQSNGNYKLFLFNQQANGLAEAVRSGGMSQEAAQKQLKELYAQLSSSKQKP